MAIFMCLSLIGVTSCNKKGDSTANQNDKTRNSAKAAKYAARLEIVSVIGGEYETPVYAWKYNGITSSDNNTQTVSVKNFQIATTETTYETWYDVLKWATDEKRGDNRYRFINSGNEGMEPAEGTVPSQKKTHPVTNVSWKAAIVWCNALSEKAGFEPVYYLDGAILRDEKKLQEFKSSANTWENDDTVEKTVKDLEGNLTEESISSAVAKEIPLYTKLRIDEEKNGFRLPTIYEWIYAARGGKPGSFDWDMDYAGSDTASEVGWFREECGWMQEIKDFNEFSSEYGTKPVAKKKKNSLGLYDMSGNVQELTNTLFFDVNGDYISGTIYIGAYVAGAQWSDLSSADYSKVSIVKSEFGNTSSVGVISSIDKTKGYITGFRVVRTSE